jgi:hypothetical protein
MSADAIQPWPALPADTWADTLTTLHLWSQIVGKVRLAQTPWVNHSWHVTLYVTARGLTTSPIPFGARTFQIDFDLIEQALRIETDDGRQRSWPLEPEPIAAFYTRLMGELDSLALPVRIYPRPNEVPDPVPFEQDTRVRIYDRGHAQLYWRALVDADRVLKRFRARFIGKCSPVHYFWGAPDLAVTRFSGRPAPEHPGGVPNLPDRVAREAYSHEVSSAGFWSGGNGVPPSFYSYAYPEPDGFASASAGPAAAYSTALREFLLPYDEVRRAAQPDERVLAFLQATYEAAADRAGWDRRALERQGDPPGGP